LALGLAAGLSLREAATQAGYGPKTKSFYALQNDAAFMAKVQRLRRRREWGGLGDVADIVGALLSKSMSTQSDTAGQNLSRLCLVSAAELLLKMPRTSLEPGPSDRELDAWAAAYSVK
ncbi:MAG TPA: hypothetical protein VIE16_11425, partial [Phenylobacterium sp.]